MPTPLARDIHHPGSPSFLRHHISQTMHMRNRNINLLSIDYALQPRLRSRLTLGGLTFPRNPWASGECVSHTLCATHADILTSIQSTAPRGTTSPRIERSPTDPCIHMNPAASAACLAPCIFGAEILDQ